MLANWLLSGYVDYKKWLGHPFLLYGPSVYPLSSYSQAINYDLNSFMSYISS
jgi:hypothetical protein